MTKLYSIQEPNAFRVISNAFLTISQKFRDMLFKKWNEIIVDIIIIPIVFPHIHMIFIVLAMLEIFSSELKFFEICDVAR